MIEQMGSLPDRFDDRNVNARASCAGILEFKPRGSQILYSIANGSLPI